jgi:RNA recognition motif-containing protein
MKLFVAGLPLDMDNQELKEMLEEFGKVTSAKVILDRETHKSRGFGFVDMADDTAALVAMDELNVSELDGKRLSVKVAEDKRPSNGSSQPGGNRKPFTHRSNTKPFPDKR